jgi:hypothetical protein
MNSNILTSWKEIATHLGKSVRTAQRWERELGLPVRRPSLRHFGIVLADAVELDSWLHEQTTPLHAKPNGGNGNGNAEVVVEALRRRCEELEQELDGLRKRCEELEVLTRTAAPITLRTKPGAFKPREAAAKRA